MNMVHGLLKVEGNASAGTDKLHPLTASAEARCWTPQKQNDVRQRNARRKSQPLTRLVAIGTVLTLPCHRHHAAHGQSDAGAALDGESMAAGHSHHAGDVLLRPPDPRGRIPRTGAPLPRYEFARLVGTSAAYLYSLVTCVAPQVFPEGSREPYFESVGVVITLVLVGRLLETKAREGTGKAVQSLIKLRPRTAHKLNAASPENVEWLNPANFTDMDIDTIAVAICWSSRTASACPQTASSWPATRVSMNQ